jgi:hypothetical protein
MKYDCVNACIIDGINFEHSFEKLFRHGLATCLRLYTGCEHSC